MSFLDELKKMTRPYDDDDEFFDDEDEAIPVAEAAAPARPAPARPAPARPARARRTAPAPKKSTFIRDDPVTEPERPAPGYAPKGDSRVADKVVNLNSGGQLKVVLGTPKQAAQERNTQRSPYTWRESPWRLAALALAVLSALVLLMEGVWPVMLLPLNASVGVIGGADGPTAIFVAQQPQAVHTEMIIAAVLLVLGLAAYFRLRHCRRREP